MFIQIAPQPETIEKVALYGVNRKQLKEILRYLYSEYGIDASVEYVGVGRNRRFELSAPRFDGTARKYLDQYPAEPGGEAVEDHSGRARWALNRARAQGAVNRVLIQR